MNTINNISNSYPTIENNGELSFGGSQSWFSQKYLQKVGCGLIACTNLLLYLQRYGVKENIPYALAEYIGYAEQLKKKFFPVIPGFGMTGWQMALGLHLYFRKNHMKIKVRWGVRRDRLWLSMEEMLSKKLPVIMSVGPNFPFVWKKHKLPFYVRKNDGSYVQSCQVKGHYVTVTEMDDTWMGISSWGKKFYIKRQEYMEYACRYSGFLVSNIVYLH